MKKKIHKRASAKCHTYQQYQLVSIGVLYFAIIVGIGIACNAAYGGTEKNENAASIATTLIGCFPPVLFLSFRMCCTSTNKKRTYQAVAAGICIALGGLFVVIGWGKDSGWVGLNILVGVAYGGVQAAVESLLQPKRVRSRWDPSQAMPEFAPILTDEDAGVDRMEMQPLRTALNTSALSTSSSPPSRGHNSTPPRGR